jgi:endonuclease/exonuclease/phosphatase family metal-dependent hydrolase
VSFRLLSYNVRHGGAGREDALADVITACNPDLVVFQEATRPDVIERLAVRCGMAECATRPKASLGFMSRQSTLHYAWHRPRLSRHAFLEVHPSGVDFRVFGVHLSAVHAAWTERRRALELSSLLRTIHAHEHGFHVLAGDFNTLAPGELLDVRKLPHRLRALVWLSGGRIRWRTIEIVLNAGYVDGFKRLHPSDTGLTFPVWDPHVRLDYVFLPSDRAARLLTCEVARHPRSPAASDHFPLLADIAEKNGGA